jgi:hypothetical protein
MNFILTFINNLIKSSSIMFEEFLKFIVENKLSGLFIVAFSGLAISSLISSIKINIIDYYLNKLFKTTNNNLINVVTSLIQTILIIIILYFIYNNLFKPLDKKYIISKFDDIAWKNDLLTELKTIRNQMK